MSRVPPTDQQPNYDLASKKSRTGVKAGPDTWGNADAVRQHIHELLELGMTYAAIARRSGIGHQRVAAAAADNPPRLFASTAKALLAVKYEHAYLDEERQVPWPLQRRVGALNRLGWPLTQVAAEAGIEAGNLNQMMRHGGRNRHFVNATQNLGVQLAYDKLSNSPGPRDSVRLLARQHGWPPPAAWLPGELDDPEETVTTRVRIRWEGVDKPSPGELLFDLIEKNDYTHEEFAQLLGVHSSTVVGWVSDRYLPRSSYARKMEEILGIQELPMPTISPVRGPRS